MQDPEQVRSFYCGECGAEGDIEYDLGDGFGKAKLTELGVVDNKS